MPTPFFADLVREIAQEGGTGPLMPTGAVPGHRRFADAVPADTGFYYSIAGVAHPDEWETGIGHIDGAGRLVRQSVASSSSGGATVAFAPGLKTLALTVGADWFAETRAAQSALDLALAGKQPVSTGHDAVATATATDLVTARRGAGWVNVPMSALAFRGGDGRFALDGALAAGDGSAAAPPFGFAAQSGTGLFRAGGAIGFALGGAEYMRLAAGGKLGLGVSNPGAFIDLQHGGTGEASLTLSNTSWDRMLHFQAISGGFRINSRGGSDTSSRELRLATGGSDRVIIDASGNVGIGPSTAAARVHAKSTGEIMRLEMTTARGGGTGFATFHDPSGRKGYWGYGGPNDTLYIMNDMNAPVVFGANGVHRWQIENGGSITPLSDGAYNIGWTSSRVQNLYLANAPIITSDETEKDWLGSGLTDAELRAARRIGSEIGSYRWLTSIAAEAAGGDAARIHIGVRAQAVWAIMADEGLIAETGEGARPDSRYAFLCWDRWGGETGGERFGIRADQLALFLIAAQDARIAALEAAA